MGNTKKIFNAKAAEKFAGKGGIAQYFNPKKKRGRPPKKSNKQNKTIATSDSTATKSPPTTATTTINTSSTTTTTVDLEISIAIENNNNGDMSDEDNNKTATKKEEPKQQKKTRRNWGVGEDRMLMENAVNDWLNDGELKHDDDGEEITDYVACARRQDMPPSVFYKHACPNNRRQIGDGRRGKPRLLEDDEIKLIGSVCARRDRANDGLTRAEATDLIQQLKPEITRDAARLQLSRVVMPTNAAKGLIKGELQTVQATTSDRTNINVAQQHRWHAIVDKLHRDLEDKNTGRCNMSGKSFPLLMGHFIIGLDEMCLMSDQHGGLKIIGSADKKKHEKLLQDSRVSITIVRTGTAWGTDGPTVFLVKGEKVKKGHDEAFLVKHGLAKGSTVVATENACVTDVAWLEVSKAIVRGCRELPCIKENPQWHVAELLDGFKSHENVLAAHELRAQNNIDSLKEESNSSHVNQGHDQLVAKNDKKVASETLHQQRSLAKIKTGKTNIDQCDLVVTGIHIVNSTTPVVVSAYLRVS